jgi:hypothetical protein
MMQELSNLPKPSEKIINHITNFYNNNKPNNASSKWFSKTQNKSINCAEGKFFVDPNLTILAYLEFYSIISDKFRPDIGILQNIFPERGPCFVPPHIDKYRSTALLFAIETGGTECTTSCYKTKHDLYIPNETIMVDYDSVEIISTTRTKPMTWYALNVQAYHSVENITDVRLLFSLSIPSLPYDLFLKKYNHFI